MPHEQKQELFRDLEDVCSALISSETWHAKASTECRNIGVIGWSKWHEKESIIHKKCLDKLTKILQKNLEFTPQLNLKHFQKINQFEINNIDDFIEHHFEWIKREEMFNDMLIYPLKESKKINRELHEQLENLQEEAQFQISLVKKVFKRLEFAQFMPHDIGVCSKWIEDYFDYEYKPGCKISFNIG